MHDRLPLCSFNSIFTGSIARSAMHRYSIYLEADLRFFARSAGATVAPIGVKCGTGEGAEVPNFTPIGATVMV